MFALVDCNNFYASCERLFRPDLKTKPIVVLSNNDGCIIARSNEAKSLGFAMGAPFFKVKNNIQRHNVKVFSSNYTLYGDISSRVMSVLASLATEQEIYSIDEAFLDLTGLASADWLEYGKQIRQTVYRRVGIPVSVGLAPTKTLAKAANHIAKKKLLPLQTEGVFHLAKSEPAALNKIDISAVWGIGRRYTQKLRHHGVHSALDFVQLAPQWVRQEMRIGGWFTQQELLGFSYLNLVTEGKPRQSVVFSRSFGTTLHQSQDLQQVIATYASSLGRKLRRYKRKTAYLQVFLQRGYPSRKTFLHATHLPFSTNDSRVLIENALYLLQQIVHKHPNATELGVKKAGIVALDLQDEAIVQQKLFGKPPADQVMQVLDQINAKMGQGTLRIASASPRAKWQMRQRLRSPRYTTRWTEIPRIVID